ncbi:hypothetical protein B0H13DRAFT_2270689 [Mycena leptocephala]|nr:hypothetical protein B0H13DRAFT_2270689 [Mycena leptocephala]
MDSGIPPQFLLDTSQIKPREAKSTGPKWEAEPTVDSGPHRFLLDTSQLKPTQAKSTELQKEAEPTMQKEAEASSFLLFSYHALQHWFPGIQKFEGAQITRFDPKGAYVPIRSFIFRTTIFMGRRAKYLTAEARAQADKQACKKYAQTTRAKIVRTCTQRARYMQSRTEKGRSLPTRCIPALPPLPARIVELQELPLPESQFLFKEALRSAQALDESGLERRNCEPPFDDDRYDADDPDAMHPHSERARRYTERLGWVLHGMKMREQAEKDASRRADFKHRGWDVCMAELRVEVATLLHGRRVYPTGGSASGPPPKHLSLCIIGKVNDVTEGNAENSGESSCGTDKPVMVGKALQSRALTYRIWGEMRGKDEIHPLKIPELREIASFLGES